MSEYSFSLWGSNSGTGYVDIPTGYVYEVGDNRPPVLPSVKMKQVDQTVTGSRYYALIDVAWYTSGGSLMNYKSSTKWSASTALGSYSAATAWDTDTSTMPTVSNLFNSNNSTARQVSIRLKLLGYSSSNHSLFRNGYWENGAVSFVNKYASSDTYISPEITFKLNAPPTFSSTNVSFSPSGTAYTGLTTASVTLSSLSAKYGGTISSAVLKIGNQTASRATNGTLSILLNSAGTFTPTVTVTDSRGQVTTKSLASITVKAYSAPTVSMSVTRATSTGVNSDDGTYAVVKAKFSYTSGAVTLSAPTVTAEYNGSSVSPTVTWYSTRASNGTLSGSVTWSSLASGSTVYALISKSGGFETSKTYQIGITPIDSKKTGTKIVRALDPAFYTVDFLAGGHGVAFGEAATEEKFVVNLPAKFKNKFSMVGNSTEDIYLVVQNEDSGISVGLGVGSSNTNHGVWSWPLNKWMIYSDGTNSYVNGIQMDFGSWTSTSGVFTPASGITISMFRFLKWGKLAQLFINWKSSSAVSVGADGNATNVTVGTLASGFRPWTTSVGTSYGDNAGPAFYSVETTGNVILGACGGTGSSRTIAAGTTFQIGATFFLA